MADEALSNPLGKRRKTDVGDRQRLRRRNIEVQQEIASGVWDELLLSSSDESNENEELVVSGGSNQNENSGMCSIICF